MSHDIIIIGGGLVGLATAYRLLEARPDARVVVLEKEDTLAQHQSGRNSGVLHAGVYYRPGSAKARLCRTGKAQMEAFCEAEGVPWRRCGKVIVAVDAGEVPRLRALEERARANGVAAERIGPERLRETEPHARAVEALWVPETGVVDFAAVAHRLAARVEDRGGTIRTGATVTGARETPKATVVETAAGPFEARVVVNAAGLWADCVARRFGVRTSVQLVPFRGEYVALKGAAARLCRGLVYPVPDPAFPFLGVHLTRTVHGHVEAGPSAVPAFAREGYRLSTVRTGELWEALRYAGFRRLARKHWRMGLAEMGRSVSHRAFLRAVRRLVPEVTAADLGPAPAGVRAQAVFPDGSLADDFVIEATHRAVHVINAPSPAATAALAVGQHVAALALERL